VVSAYAAGGACRGVVNVDQPLLLGGFQEALVEIEPMLRGDGFATAIQALFDSMTGSLPPHERWRVEHLRQPDQEVVLGAWEMVLSSPGADLDALVAGLVGSIRVPYLSLHGIDPGPSYLEWLTGALPSATWEVWDAAGHHPHLVDPGRFVDRVRAFDPAG
jgi:pimeloyl-ACP methyl ester carboxylesterase